MRCFVRTALLPTGGTTFASPNEGRSFASPNFNAGRSFASPNFNAGRSFASRPFKVGTLFCRLMTKAELLQVCRVSRRRMRGVISRRRIRDVVSRRRISMRDVVLLPYDQGAVFFLLLVLLCVFGVLSLRCCSPQQGGVEDRIAIPCVSHPF